MSPISAPEKRSLVLMFAVCGLLFGVAGYLTYINADPGIRLPAQPKIPAPNGFDLYVAAAKFTGQPTPPTDPASDPNSASISAATGAVRYGLARRQAWHRGAARGWALFRQAQRTPTRDAYGWGAERMPGYARLRELARNKSAETRLFRMRGEPDKAMSSALDSIQMGVGTAQGGALISRLVSTAIIAIALSPVSETEPGQTVQLPEQLSGPQARRAAARLEALLNRRFPYEAAMQNTRWDALATLQRAFDRQIFRAPDAFTYGAPAEPESVPMRLARLTVSKRTVVAHINAAYDEAIRDLKAPYKPLPPAANAPVFGANGPADARDPISAPLLPRNGLRFNLARENTQLGLMLLRVALRAYRAQNGRYPVTLGALRPRLLRRIPTDDFAGGKPYGYALKGATYRLWSVGPDGVDDGGQAIAPSATKNLLPWQNHWPSILSDSTGDVVAGEVR